MLITAMEAPGACYTGWGVALPAPFKQKPLAFGHVTHTTGNLGGLSTLVSPLVFITRIASTCTLQYTVGYTSYESPGEVPFSLVITVTYKAACGTGFQRYTRQSTG